MAVLDANIGWLNANGKEKTTYHGWGEKTTTYIPAWTEPARRLTDVIINHYRPETPE